MKKIWIVCLAAVCVLNACAQGSVAATGSAVPAASVTVQSPQTTQSPMPTQTPAASETLSPSASEKTSVDVDYTFKGENADWQGEYHVWGTVIYRNAENVWVTGTTQHTFTATYKKDVSSLAKVKRITVQCKSIASKLEISEHYTKSETRPKTFSVKGSGNSSVPDKDEVMKLTISLDGKPQVIDLKCE